MLGNFNSQLATSTKPKFGVRFTSYVKADLRISTHVLLFSAHNLTIYSQGARGKPPHTAAPCCTDRGQSVICRSPTKTGAQRLAVLGRCQGFRSLWPITWARRVTVATSRHSIKTSDKGCTWVGDGFYCGGSRFRRFGRRREGSVSNLDCQS